MDGEKNNTVEVLLKKAEGEADATKAMQFAQAACNAASALMTMSAIPRNKEEKNP